MKSHPATRLTLEKLRKESWPLIERVETWVPFPPPGHRKDLLGMFDVLAIRANEVLGVQCTSKGGMSARRRKLNANPNLAIWKASGLRAELWGWHKVNNRWQAKIEVL